MCDVCKAELGMDSNIVLLDDIIDDDEPLKLCPVCKAAYIGMDEDMCENCLAQEERNSENEDNDDWRSYLDDEDTKDTDEIPLEALGAGAHDRLCFGRSCALRGADGDGIHQFHVRRL